MHQSSALTRFVSILVTNRKATNRQTVAYTVVKEANSMPVFDSWGRLHSSAWTFAVPRESAMVQLARMHAAVLYVRASLLHWQSVSKRPHPAAGTVSSRHERPQGGMSAIPRARCPMCDPVVCVMKVVESSRSTPLKRRMVARSQSQLVQQGYWTGHMYKCRTGSEDLQRSASAEDRLCMVEARTRRLHARRATHHWN